jgi:hypothetical protein
MCLALCLGNKLSYRKRFSVEHIRENRNFTIKFLLDPG